jgi:hypothetical protein
MLTEKGKALIREFDELYACLNTEFSPMLNDYHISTQVYGFSRDIFFERNPFPITKSVV